MTLIALWPNKVKDATSLNIASDSRLTDIGGRPIAWDFATKIYRLHPTQLHMAYCGTSSSALQAILQSALLLNASNILAGPEGVGSPTIDAQTSSLRRHLEETIRLYPGAWGNEATILCAAYDWRLKMFRAYTLAFNGTGMSRNEVDLKSRRCHFFGSGAPRARAILGNNAAQSSREIFFALRDVIESPSQTTVGGAPQMVCIKRQGSQQIGFNWTVNGKIESMLGGVPLKFNSDLKKIEFRDRNYISVPYLRGGRRSRRNKR
jgi:hypothetical protein